MSHESTLSQSAIMWTKKNSKSKIHILPNYEQADLKTAIVAVINVLTAMLLVLLLLAQ